MEHNNNVSFLTWNIYFGTVLTPLFTSTNIPQSVTEVFRQFLATNFPVRAQAIARQIALKKPDLIGLQEAARWDLIIPAFGTVTYDFIEILLEELKDRGLHYEVAAEVQNASGELPDSHGNLVRFLDRNAILILKEHKLKVINRQEANFKVNPSVDIGGKPFIALSGWAFIDVKINDQVFRMITTHLDPNVPQIRAEQAGELLVGPANTNLPLIVTGDFNSTPTSSIYGMFIAAGFNDVWVEVGEGPGFTCCQDSDVLNDISTLSQRIDYIWFKNGWKPIDADLVGEKQRERTKTGLWPSDHAGVSATLHLEGHHHHHRHHHHHHEESSDESSS